MNDIETVSIRWPVTSQLYINEKLTDTSSDVSHNVCKTAQEYRKISSIILRAFEGFKLFIVIEQMQHVVELHIFFVAR